MSIQRFDEIEMPEGAEIVIRIGPKVWGDGNGCAAVEMYEPSQLEQIKGEPGHLPRVVRLLAKAMLLGAELRAGRIPEGWVRTKDGSALPAWQAEMEGRA